MAQSDLNELDVPHIDYMVEQSDGVFSREEIEAFVDYCRAAVLDAPEVERFGPAPITKEIALGLGYRAEIYSILRKDSKGFPVKARVNGKVKTWKREVEDPIEPRDHPKGDFILPVKYGMYEAFQIHPFAHGADSASFWTAEHPDDWPQVASSLDIFSRWLRHTQRGLVPMAHQFGERQRIGHLTLKKLSVRIQVTEEDIETGELLERMRERDVQSTSEAYVDLKPKTKPITNLDDWTMGPWAYQVEQVDRKGDVVEAALYYVSDAVLPWSGRMTVRRRTNPDDTRTHVPRWGGNTGALAEVVSEHDAISVVFADLIEMAPSAFPHPVALVVDEKTALNGRDPHSRAHACAEVDDSGRGVVYIAPKLVTGFLEDPHGKIALFEADRADTWPTRLTAAGARALRDRQVGVLSHELGHIALLFRGNEDHTERDADAEAERLFGKRINYDIEDVQTVGRGVHPRPKRLDVDENPRSNPCAPRTNPGSVYKTTPDLKKKQEVSLLTHFDGKTKGKHKIVSIETLIPVQDQVGPKHVQELASLLEAGYPLPPIAITDDGEILDGHHRHEAALQLGIRRVPVLVVSPIVDENPRRRPPYKGKRGPDVPGNEKGTGRISGATWWKYTDDGFDDDAHAEAMEKAGWKVADFVVGRRVLLSFSNDHEVWGVIKKIYKKGTVDFQPDEGELYRGAVGGRDFWVRDDSRS